MNNVDSVFLLNRILNVVSFARVSFSTGISHRTPTKTYDNVFGRRRMLN